MLRMRRWLKSDASELSSALYPKMLNSIEDAHLKNMGTFETDEHLQARCLLPRLPRLGRLPPETDLVALPLIAYGAIRVRVTTASLEGEAEWTSLLGHHALCPSCGL